VRLVTHLRHGIRLGGVGWRTMVVQYALQQCAPYADSMSRTMAGCGWSHTCGVRGVVLGQGRVCEV
jgi:hypothetical protein